MQRPPDGVRLVIEAVCIIKGVKPKRVPGEKASISHSVRVTLVITKALTSKTTVHLFDAHCCHISTAIKHNSKPDQVKPSFVIFDIWVLWCSGLSVRVPDVKNYKRQLNPAWHRILCSCTHVATMGVKGLNRKQFQTTFEQVSARYLVDEI